MLTGVFAQKALNHAGADGALFGNLSQLAIQAIACVASGVYAAVVTFVILKVIDVTIGLRLPDADVGDAGADLATDPPTVRSPGAA
jgi:Amt family ammonium transporter